MRRNRLSVWLAAAGILLSLTLVFAGARAQSASPQAPAFGSTASKLAAEQFKNIQALKAIPADQVVPSMQFIAASLGVECEYCHVRGAFEKDDKKSKITARKMIGMMMAINKENFEGHREVTCYSCHRGAKDPVGTPIITDEDPAPGAAEEKAAGEGKPALPTADQLLDKYLAAIGGADALQKITSRVQKGKLTSFGGQKSPAEVYSKAPNKRLAVMHLQGQ
jgi:photosynthetic reaction center cytochrome c subunit